MFAVFGLGAQELLLLFLFQLMVPVGAAATVYAILKMSRSPTDPLRGVRCGKRA